MQLTVMSSAVIGFLAGDPGRRALAGDQLYVDLDLSHDNLPAGSLLTIGNLPGGWAVVEVTDQPHRGCAKFVHRFGADAMRAVNGAEGRRSRLRGSQRPGRRPGQRPPGRSGDRRASRSVRPGPGDLDRLTEGGARHTLLPSARRTDGRAERERV